MRHADNDADGDMKIKGTLGRSAWKRRIAEDVRRQLRSAVAENGLRARLISELNLRLGPGCRPRPNSTERKSHSGPGLA